MKPFTRKRLLAPTEALMVFISIQRHDEFVDLDSPPEGRWIAHKEMSP
jgi:hypothetical protein